MKFKTEKEARQYWETNLFNEKDLFNEEHYSLLAEFKEILFRNWVRNGAPLHWPEGPNLNLQD